MTNELNFESLSTEPKVEKSTGINLANDLKNLRRRRLQRKIFSDPSMAKELVKVESSPVYNAKAEIIQAVSTNYGDA